MTMLILMAHSVPTRLTPEPLSSHDRILQAAKRLFCERGYENASTVAIARLAGTSESQLMKHFGSKEGLLEAIFDKGWLEMAPLFRQLQQLPSGTEKLETLLDLMLAALERDPELKELMLLEGRRIRKEGHMVLLTQGYAQFIGFIDAVLNEMRAKGELREGVSIEAIRSALVAMFEGLVRDQVLARRMNFPAKFDSAEVRKIFPLVISGFVTQPQK